MFYDKFLELCNQKNKAPSVVADELGFARSSITKWKSGTTLRSANLKRVADYFGVPVSYFSEEDQETEKSPAPDKGTEDFARYFAMLTPEHQQQIRAAMAELIKEQLQG
uniref:Repressor protein CI n=1 Tax=Siphoviridae sp. ct3pR10 TaxID=2826284 RepID=A0A8S5LX31_9CAUD|nr:MAG TPA: Repressor protein CI [Siphoviridae sp. ct3pR10]